MKRFIIPKSGQKTGKSSINFTIIILTHIKRLTGQNHAMFGLFGAFYQKVLLMCFSSLRIFIDLFKHVISDDSVL